MELSKQSVAVLNKVNDYVKRRTEAIEGMTFLSEDYREGYSEAMSEIHWFITSAIEVNGEANE
jgi:hypothetical protein